MATLPELLAQLRARGPALAMAVAIALQSFAGRTALSAEAPGAAPDMSILSADEWARIDRSSERALEWLSFQQRPDGSFPTLLHGQPGVTSLCVMAFMAHGHLPGSGPHGEKLQRALEFIRAQQKPSGLIAAVAPGGRQVSRNVRGDVGTVVAYNHAISALTLSEAYASVGGSEADATAGAIELALRASLTMQRWPKSATDHGGWRYVNLHDAYDSDLSITGWELMFLRSAKNAGFEVPQRPIDDAVAYVRRCFDRRYGVFEYEVSPRDRRSRAMAGAGVLALAHAGFHNSVEAQRSGEWILRHNFNNYNQPLEFSAENRHKDRYHYGVFNCSQAMYQLGGRFWAEFYPGAAAALVANQNRDGSWPIEANGLDGKYGPAYSTALAVLALGAPNQLLPIFQR